MERGKGEERDKGRERMNGQLKGGKGETKVTVKERGGGYSYSLKKDLGGDIRPDQDISRCALCS